MSHPVRPPSQPAASAGSSPSLAARWAPLARAVGLAQETPVLVALSGGADSVLLLHIVAAAARERALSDRALSTRARTARASGSPPSPPRVTAVHVEHGLRGAAGEADAEFCAQLCIELSVPFVRRAIALDPAGPSLEARAREQRYRALCTVAEHAGVHVILTGHHADDALETLLQRWLRGTDLHGLAGLRPRLTLRAELRPSAWAGERERLNPTAIDIEVVRPLIAMRREEVRRILLDHGRAWREDASNASARFTRNRVRNQLLPEIASVCGPEAIENLRAFGAAVETLEERCAERTVALSWMPPLHAAACRGADEADLGGTLERARLEELVGPLRRRALWRLLTEGTGRAPSRVLLTAILADLDAGRRTRHNLPGAWSLRLRSNLLHLEPPARSNRLHLVETDDGGTPVGDETTERFAQLDLPFDPHGARRLPRPEASGLKLSLPGIAALPDGRQVSAELVELPASVDVLRSPLDVELDAHDLGPLRVRFPEPGDRFHGLGAPGSRALGRFLADAGVPRRDRARVPLVLAGDEIIWVAGIRPCEARRVRATTEMRLRLSLHHPIALARTHLGMSRRAISERRSLF